MEDILFSNLEIFDGTGTHTTKKGLLVRDSKIKSVAKVLKYISAHKITLVVYKVEEGVHLDQMIRQRVAQVLFGAEFHYKKDHGHQSNSGLDKPLVELMKQKNCSYGFCISDIATAMNSKEARKIIPRISQNLMLLRKYDCKYLEFSGDISISSQNRSQFLSTFTKR